MKSARTSPISHRHPPVHPAWLAARGYSVREAVLDGGDVSASQIVLPETLPAVSLACCSQAAVCVETATGGKGVRHARRVEKCRTGGCAPNLGLLA